MQPCDKIKVLRERAGLSQRNLAVLCHCGAASVSRIESGSVSVTREFLSFFRKAIDNPYVPIFDEEVAAFKHTLYEWGVMLRRAQIDRALAERQHLEQGATGSCESDIEILYNLFSIAFLRSIGDYDKAYEVFAAVSRRKAEFSQEHWHGYRLQTGNFAMDNRKYFEAIDNYVEAERLSAEVPFTREGLYYNIAACYTYTDRPVLALKYAEMGKGLDARFLDVRFDSLTALNWAKLGRYDDALAMLLDCQQRHSARHSSTDSVNKSRHNIGCVHLAMGNAELALAEFSRVRSDTPRTDQLYVTNVLFMTYALFAANRFDDAWRSLSEGETIAAGTEPYQTLFAALRHSKTPERADSLEYIMGTAIPSLAKMGCYIKAAEYCERVAERLADERRYKLSAKYIAMALDFNKTMMNGGGCR